ncbi:MAG: hypothetical protein KH586_08755 [Tannerella sp.]|nr:hypothetical protein [Tannerella sp.]
MNTEIKKKLILQRGEAKLKIKQLIFLQETTGIKKEKEIDKLLDRIDLINKILNELENKK